MVVLHKRGLNVTDIAKDLGVSQFDHFKTPPENKK